MFTYDRPIMRPSEIDDMFKLVNEVIRYGKMTVDQDECNALANYRTFERLSHTLVMFIVEHDVAVLDLLSRGRSDTSIHYYERDEQGKVIPYVKESEN